MGTHREGFGGEHAAGAAESGNHFVVEQQDGVPIQEGAQAREISGGRYHTASAVGNRIQDHRAHRLGAGPLDGLLNLGKHAAR